MTGTEFLQEIKELGMSQGMYSRLYNQLKDMDSETLDRMAIYYTNMLDFIIEYEG
jgi:hypothetical protein